MTQFLECFCGCIRSHWFLLEGTEFDIAFDEIIYIILNLNVTLTTVSYLLDHIVGMK